MSFTIFRNSQKVLLSMLLLMSGLMLSMTSQQVRASTEELLSSHYLQLDPLILNVESPRRRGAYLKVTPVLVSTDSSFHSRLEENVPLVRNALLSLYSNHSVDQLLAKNAMDDLRTQSLKTMRDLLRKQDGVETLSDVLFMEFVVQ